MTVSAEEELALIERVKGGDTAAFGTLMRPYRARLAWAILRVVHNPSDVDDVMQEAMLRVFRALDTFRGEAGLYTWMYRIAYHCALAFAARYSPDRERERAQGLHWDSCECDCPENIVFGSQMVAAFESTLETLQSDFKTAIVLHQLEGMSYLEVSDQMRCPVGTVRSRISTARGLIASRLRQRGFGVGQP
jgi:RNA polymerase sigma-70 factor, ECF subfamily